MSHDLPSALVGFIVDCSTRKCRDSVSIRDSKKEECQ